ncbi:amidoligase family protein [Balneola sp. MJW-20]|uniref:amidoligase family protein n=1 Tax=Gracilimonas aurantiaca TaxID=3234185 RepID=UPI00346754E1
MSTEEQNRFVMPPCIENDNGEERKAGYEIEFTGLDIGRSAEIIRELYGGEIKKESEYEFKVCDTEFGDFKLELDASLIRDKKYEKFLSSIGIQVPAGNSAEMESLIKNAATPWVPFEIVTPPVELTRMHQLNAMTNRLREEKAIGTKDSFLYAFGMHINPEAPSLKAQSILDHLRAFMMLDPWIRKDAGIDLSRRITPYIDPFGKDYMRKILDPAYPADLSQLIKEYFRFGNSRNRALDLLPMFMCLNEGLTSALLKEELTSARPTYHYRLPNCEIDDPAWSLASEWNRWVRVEQLANDKEQLSVNMNKWMELNEKFTIRKKGKWIRIIEKWIE